jgi:hypothetical protein
LGKIDAPFFGVPKKEKREKRRKKYAILRSAERRAWGAYVEFINRPVQLTVSARLRLGQHLWREACAA